MRECQFEGPYDQEAIWKVYGVAYVGKGLRMCYHEHTQNPRDTSMCPDRESCPIWQQAEIERLQGSLGLKGITLNGRSLVNELIAKIKRRKKK